MGRLMCRLLNGSSLGYFSFLTMKIDNLLRTEGNYFLVFGSKVSLWFRTAEQNS